LNHTLQHCSSFFLLRPSKSQNSSFPKNLGTSDQESMPGATGYIEKHCRTTRLFKDHLLASARIQRATWAVPKGKSTSSELRMVSGVSRTSMGKNPSSSSTVTFEKRSTGMGFPRTLHQLPRTLDTFRVSGNAINFFLFSSLGEREGLLLFSMRTLLYLMNGKPTEMPRDIGSCCDLPF